MSAIPAYFKGGIAPGSHVNVTYIGDLETTSLEEVRIIAVTGEDPDTCLLYTSGHLQEIFHLLWEYPVNYMFFFF